MPLYRIPGPLGTDSVLDEDGLLCRAPGAHPGPVTGAEHAAQPAGDDVEPEFQGEPLKLGSQGAEVTQLQKRLNERLSGHTKLAVNGSFDAPTEAAVRLFQWLVGLPIDGIVGPLTRRALPLRKVKSRSRGKGRVEPPPPEPPRKRKAPPPEPQTDVFELVELVEVVTQGAEKWVKGAANDNTDTATIAEHVERTDKHQGLVKQYINVGKDVEGKSKRHPEYGREITLKARVKRKSGTLAGANVEFSFKRADGPSRSGNVWKGADLTGSQKEGFGGANGTKTVTATTDAKGWTSAVTFALSAYGGDQFEVSAKLADDTPGAPGKTAKTATKYIVWRKFWYQLTHAKGFNVPDATKAAAAYDRVAAELVKANKKEFQKSDLPADLQPRTFMPAYMLEQGAGAGEVATIGGHNKLEFAKMMTKEAEHPLKAHVIVCEYQCDPAGKSKLETLKLTSRTQTFTIGSGTGGSIVSKPALKAGAKLVIVGEYATQKSPWTKLGNITDADIAIDAARGSTMDVKITLPGAAPAPSAAKPVYVRLQLETADSYLGESFGSGQILCVYRPNAAAGDQGSEVDYNDTVAHEMGHMWNQTPEPGAVPASLKNHPLQYVGHGGQGSHCRDGAAVAAGAVNWQDADEETPSPQEGTCVMFHSYSAKCSHVFCATCEPYLRLQDMSSL